MFSEITCKFLNLTNGKIKTNGPMKDKAVISSQAVFTCNPGYDLIGSANIICLSNGKWSDEMPFCKGIRSFICSLISLLKNIYLNSLNYTCLAVDCGYPPDHLVLNFGKFTLLNQSTNYQSLAKLDCGSNIEPLGTNSIIKCQEDGQWSKVYATCDHQCK